MSQLQNIDLNLLLALDALLTEVHISRAAIRVGCSQPTMSRALGRLRHILGDDLLAREGNEYHLTPVAEGLVEPVRDILHLIEQTLTNRHTFDPGSARRRFRMFVGDDAEYLLIRPLLTRLASEAPGISLEIEQFPRNRSTTIEALETGEVDLGLWALNIFQTRLAQCPLYEDRLVCVVSASRTDIGDEITLDELAALPSVTHPFQVHSQDLSILPDWLKIHPAPVPVIESNHISRLFLVQDTNLVTFVSELLALSLAPQLGLRVVEPAFETPVLKKGLAWLPRFTNEPGHSWLRQQILDIARSRLSSA